MVEVWDESSLDPASANFPSHSHHLILILHQQTPNWIENPTNKSTRDAKRPKEMSKEESDAQQTTAAEDDDEPDEW